MNFADSLTSSILRSRSVIVAGCDPMVDTFPRCILEEAQKKGKTTEDAIRLAIQSFYELTLSAIAPHIAAIKPNLGFFEAYGLAGLRAFVSLCSLAKDLSLPLIADGKRGDIGSTAEGYANAYLAQSTAFGKSVQAFNVDALTVNPFLGFDTLEPFVKACNDHGKGIFVLVRTSNTGATALQDATVSGGGSVSDRVATWLDERGQALVGTCGYSSLGAVVGATHPEEARKLRSRMPRNYFLIPGMGAQGGSAQDATAGFSDRKGGAVINLSRGIFSSFSSRDISKESISAEVLELVSRYNREIQGALG